MSWPEVEVDPASLVYGPPEPTEDERTMAKLGAAVLFHALSDLLMGRRAHEGRAWRGSKHRQAVIECGERAAVFLFGNEFAAERAAWLERAGISPERATPMLEKLRGARSREIEKIIRQARALVQTRERGWKDDGD